MFKFILMYIQENLAYAGQDSPTIYYLTVIYGSNRNLGKMRYLFITKILIKNFEISSYGRIIITQNLK